MNKITGRVCLMSALLCSATAPAVTQKGGKDPARSGQELAKRVLQTQDSSGFRARARVVIGADEESAPKPIILQIRIVGLKEQGFTKILYQVLYPVALKGHAAVLLRQKGPELGGFSFEPPALFAPMTPALAESSFAGSALTLEDLTENFWQWPHQKTAGQEKKGKENCTVLESRPGPEFPSGYSLVRSCISNRRPQPLWIEKLGRNGKLAKRIVFEHAGRGSQGPRAIMIADDGIAAHRTRIEIISNERGIAVDPEEFSGARLKAYAK